MQFNGDQHPILSECVEFAKCQVSEHYCLIETHIMLTLNWTIERECSLELMYEMGELFGLPDEVLERSRSVLILSTILAGNYMCGKYSFALSCIFCAEQVMGYGYITIDYHNYSEVSN